MLAVRCMIRSVWPVHFYSVGQCSGAAMYTILAFAQSGAAGIIGFDCLPGTCAPHQCVHVYLQPPNVRCTAVRQHLMTAL